MRIREYGGRRLLRDDEGTDPGERLRAAAGFPDELSSAALTIATEATRGFHTEIAHISVDVDPDGAPPHTPDLDPEEPLPWPGLTDRRPHESD